MRILTTGGGGFIGAWLARRLAATGHQLCVLEPVERAAQFNKIVGPAVASVEWRIGDITDAEAVRAAAKGCDGIVHLAGVLTPACKADPVRGAMINLVGTLNVFNAAQALGIRRIVFTSSAGVYGPDDETTPRPITHYGTFKLACEVRGPIGRTIGSPAPASAQAISPVRRLSSTAALPGRSWA